jgi:hypothetical protein
MYSKVVVKADENGNVIGVFKNNPEYGYVRVEQVAPVISDTGWLKTAKRSSFIKGKIEDLQKLSYKANQEIPGKIVIVESLIPFNMENADRDLKVAGDTGVICRYDDQPIYRRSFYTTNTKIEDEVIHHTNADEIREVQAAQRELTSSIVKKRDAVLDL